MMSRGKQNVIKKTAELIGESEMSAKRKGEKRKGASQL